MKDKIQNEIKGIAPILASLDKKNPFIVPDGYFTSLENRTLDAIGKKPILANTTPEGYFDSLSDQILERVALEEKTKVIPFYKRPWLTIAASFILVAGAIYFMNTQSDGIDNNQEYSFDIEADEALDYLVESGDIYLSDLLSLDIDGYDLESETSSFEILEETDLNDFLNELDQEDLEDLL
jgi:hypothetical protein